MGRFEKYVKGELTIEVDNEEIVLKPTVEDKMELYRILSEIREKQILDIDKVNKFCYGLFVKSLPEEPKDEVKSFVVDKLLDIWMEIQIGMNVVKREEIEKYMEEEKEKLKKKS